MNDIALDNIRKDFPILERRVGNDNKLLVYLDNASTTQKPQQVIDSITNYYQTYNSNIHRAVYSIAEEATAAYESVRDKIASFLNISDRQEIIFVRGTTEGINLVAYAWGRKHIQKNDIIITTEYEHHSNIVPWQILAQEKGATLEYIDINDDGQLELDKLDTLLATGRVKLVAFSFMSNVLGTISDAETIISKCKSAGSLVLVDGAQAVPHMTIDIDSLGADFFTFSAHKMLGPTGIGVLHVRKQILETMDPFHGGGDMIREVHKQNTTWNDLPYKFEAGTPNIADVIGFGTAIDYLNKIGMSNVREHEIQLTKYTLDKMAEIKHLHVYGTQDISKHGGVVSFNFGDVHPHDVAQIMDTEGIAIRSGHHCAQVLMEKLDVAATSRASFYIYNTTDEIDVLINALNKVAVIFKL